VDQFGAGVQTIRGELSTLLHGRDAEARDKRLHGYLAAHVPADLSAAIAELPAAYAALSIVQTATREDLDLLQVADVHLTLGQRVGLDRLLSRVIELPRDDRWQTMARAALRDDLHAVHAQLTAEVLGGESARGHSAKGLVTAWEKANPHAAEAVKTLRSICGGRAELARVSVGLRIVRGLLSAADRPAHPLLRL